MQGQTLPDISYKDRFEYIPLMQSFAEEALAGTDAKYYEIICSTPYDWGRTCSISWRSTKNTELKKLDKTMIALGKGEFLIARYSR